MSAAQVDEFAAAIERLQALHGHFVWQGAFADLAIIVAQVQLALRHPNNKGYSAERARKVLEAWIETVALSEPALAKYLRMGFDPKHDVPT